MKLTAKAYLRIAAEDWRDKYDEVRPFCEGFARVRLGDIYTGKWGFVNEEGEVVVPLKYDRVDDFHEGLAVVKLGDKWGAKWGFVDMTGNEVVKPKYSSVGKFYEGFARVRRGTFMESEWGFIDKTGTEVIPPKYDTVWSFHEGLAEVELNDKVGWVTRENKELLLTKDQQLQIKNLVELGKITKKQLFNWINKRAV